VVNFAPRPFISGKETRYPLNMRMGGSQSMSGQFAEDKVSCPCRESNHIWFAVWLQHSAELLDAADWR
jgi:hypothetical protein